jgi:hypothetical protein
MAHEVDAGYAFIYATLNGDATLASYATGGVHRGTAPAGTTSVFVTIKYQAGRDTLTMNAVRILSQPLFVVLAAGPESSTQTIVNAASRIDALIGRTSGTTTGAKIDSCYREEPLQFEKELPTGEKRVFFGGLYRTQIEQA